mmetsp:Transcript_6136/g.10631  ORF Transcript_6136/g.10631 Transcript_6136/m.10631 type:complete len:344 (-) Transcript_6136:115-1146(-)
MATMGVVAHDVTIDRTALAWVGEAPYLKWNVHYSLPLADIITALCALTPMQAALGDVKDPKGRGLRAPATVATDNKCSAQGIGVAGTAQATPGFFKEQKEMEDCGRAHQNCQDARDLHMRANAGKQEKGEWGALTDASFVAISQGVEWEELPGATRTKTQTMAVAKKQKPAPEVIAKQPAPKAGTKSAKAAAPRAREQVPQVIGVAGQPMVPPPPPPPPGFEPLPAMPVAKVLSGPPPKQCSGGGRMKQPPPTGPAPAPPGPPGPPQEPVPSMPVSAASPAPPTAPPPPPPLTGQPCSTGPTPPAAAAKGAGGPPTTFGKGASAAATAQAKAVGEKQLECKTQ